jgi:membrane protease YdiL (CAAX protease family)
VAKVRQVIYGGVTAVGEMSWLLFVFVGISLLLALLLKSVPAVDDFASTVPGTLLLNSLVYLAVLAIVIVPATFRHNGAYVRQLLGVQSRPDRRIFWLPPLAWLGYMTLTVIAGMIAYALSTYYFNIDLDQAQETGFDNLKLPLEYIIAFIALVIMPPIAEELLFRGYLYGRLRRRMNFWWTTLFVSVLFGFVHGQWNVGIDTFVLSLFLCGLREYTGTIWASMVLHGIKNFVAYFFLFIAPLLGLNVL